MDILKLIPNQVYDIDGEKHILTNLSATVIISKTTRENSILFLDYEIVDGETPRTLADRIYDDGSLYWVILMINGMTNSVEDWPKTNNELYDWAGRAFTESQLYDEVVYVDASGNITDIEGVKFLNGQMQSGITDEEVIRNNQLEPLTRMDYLVLENDSKRSIKIIDPDYVQQFVSSVRSAIG